MKTNKIMAQAKELEEQIFSLNSRLYHLRNDVFHNYKQLDLTFSNEAFLKNIESFNEYDRLDWGITITPTSLSSLYRPLSFYSIRRKYKTKSNTRLENLSLEELIFKLNESSSDQQESLKIHSLIAKKTFALWLEKKIKKLKKVLKLILESCTSRLENKREFFRKINCFYFKNLDDTHSFATLN
jgi:hypothetical protein